MKARIIMAAAAAGAAAALAGAAFARSPAPGCTDAGRACLERVARTYIDGLLAHKGDGVLVAPNVRRTENALTNAKGADEVRESFVRTDMIESAKDVRLYVDEAKGEVIAFFLLNVDLKAGAGGGDATTKAGKTEYEVAITKPAGTYTVHEAERFKIVNGRITEIEIIAHVEDGKGQGSGWPVERTVVKGGAK